jgi:Uma2 family endonuclease
MSILDRSLPGTSRDPLYPDDDGFSMVESDFHYLAIKHLHGALSDWYRQRDDVYVAANMALYYEEGCPAKNRGPDILVGKGVRGKHARRSFRTWEEGVVPAVIVEVTSRSTQREDDLIKPRVYADIGVKEYFMFDPEGEYLEPRLRGYQLVDGDYELMAADESGGIYSPELGLRLVPVDELLRLVNPGTGDPLRTEEECAEEIEEATRRAEQAQHEASQAKSEAETERQRAAELEAELARLRASLRPLDGSNG